MFKRYIFCWVATCPQIRSGAGGHVDVIASGPAEAQDMAERKVRAGEIDWMLETVEQRDIDVMLCLEREEKI